VTGILIMVWKNLVQRCGPWKINSCGGRNGKMRKMRIGSVDQLKSAKWPRMATKLIRLRRIIGE